MIFDTSDGIVSLGRDRFSCGEIGGGGCGSCSRIFHVGRFFRLPRPLGGGGDGGGMASTCSSISEGIPGSIIEPPTKASST